ncbi:MAG TPA: putative Ig domain-containing protein, partial [Myxococcaceae bacterium]|nr:putative Ig domain-containing protein [Myxococcaceae bacterium]
GAIPPQFISTPRTSVFAGQAYTYNKDNLPLVTGTGPFTFKLNTAPSGATADPNTGAITWTPASTLSADAGFALEVDGKAGAATQTWAVQVVPLAGPPLKKGCGCGEGAAEALGLALVPLLLALRRRRTSGARQLRPPSRTVGRGGYRRAPSESRGRRGAR